MKDTKDAPKRGRIEPPAHLKGEDLTRWQIEEGKRRDAEAQALKDQILSQPTAQHWAPVPAPSLAKETQPVALKVRNPPESHAPIPGPRVADIPMQSPNGLGGFQAADENDNAQKDGRLPKSEDELLDRVKALFETDLLETDQWRLEFQLVRMLKGFFDGKYETASDFWECKLQDYITIEAFQANWDRVKTPCWLLEKRLQKIEKNWYHPDLRLPDERDSWTRKVAGLAYRLQFDWAGGWFRLDQVAIAEICGITQQTISHSLRHLEDIKWIESRKAKGCRSKEYRCLGWLADEEEGE